MIVVTQLCCPTAGYFLPRGVCDSAEAAAAFSAFVDFGLLSTLLAARAAFGPVCLVFRLAATMWPLSSVCLWRRGTRRGRLRAVEPSSAALTGVVLHEAVAFLRAAASSLPGDRLVSKAMLTASEGPDAPTRGRSQKRCPTPEGVVMASSPGCAGACGGQQPVQPALDPSLGLRSPVGQPRRWQEGGYTAPVPSGGHPVAWPVVAS